jgi:hypothetical protein
VEMCEAACQSRRYLLIFNFFKKIENMIYTASK